MGENTAFIISVYLLTPFFWIYSGWITFTVVVVGLSFLLTFVWVNEEAQIMPTNQIGAGIYIVITVFGATILLFGSEALFGVLYVTESLDPDLFVMGASIAIKLALINHFGVKSQDINIKIEKKIKLSADMWAACQEIEKDS